MYHVCMATFGQVNKFSGMISMWLKVIRDEINDDS